MDLACKTYHERDGSTFYTACRCNCGGNFQCIIKATVRDGRVVRVEPDDRYNHNRGREDAYMTEDDLEKVRIQRRPCVVGLTWHKYAQLPERLLYPLRRRPGSARGSGEFERISWDEALDTIADKMKETREKFGPLSILSPYMPNETFERIMSYWGAGAEGWGWCSYDASRLMAQLMTGGEGWEGQNWSSGHAGAHEGGRALGLRPFRRPSGTGACLRVVHQNGARARRSRHHHRPALLHGGPLPRRPVDPHQARHGHRHADGAGVCAAAQRNL